MSLENLRSQMPEAARDIKLNLQTVLTQTVLSPAQKWGVAVAAAITARHPGLRTTLVLEARRAVGDAVVDDAMAAAALMAMNNVYYRFRHLVEKPSYGEKPARLRMNRLVRPLGAKVDFELIALAVSAINGCGTCLQAHELVVLDGGLSEEHVHDAVRIAATIQASAIALEMADAVDGATCAVA